MQAIHAEQLAVATAEDVRAFFGTKAALPQEEERARLLREVGGLRGARGHCRAGMHLTSQYAQGGQYIPNAVQVGAVLLTHYGGRAANLVLAAKRSAVRLVALLVAHLPGFRDHAIYGGRQVFFYKRAQIFAADVHGAFRGKGLGAFTDIAELTMFADYRVPVVLRKLEVLRYDPALASQVRRHCIALIGRLTPRMNDSKNCLTHWRTDRSVATWPCASWCKHGGSHALARGGARCEVCCRSMARASLRRARQRRSR